MATKSKRARGRPSEFSSQITSEICNRISEGESVRNICLSEAMPNKATIYRWLDKNAEFRDQYARAREIAADLYAEQMIEIADNCIPESAEVAKAKVQIDARKWVSSKLAPKKYGDKVTTEHTGKDGEPIQIVSMTPEDINRVIALDDC